jgi:hypothetical protein
VIDAKEPREHISHIQLTKQQKRKKREEELKIGIQICASCAAFIKLVWLDVEMELDLCQTWWAFSHLLISEIYGLFNDLVSGNVV